MTCFFLPTSSNLPTLPAHRTISRTGPPARRVTALFRGPFSGYAQIYFFLWLPPPLPPPPNIKKNHWERIAFRLSKNPQCLLLCLAEKVITSQHKPTATFFTRAVKPEGSMGAEFDKARLSTGGHNVLHWAGKANLNLDTRHALNRRAARIPCGSRLIRYSLVSDINWIEKRFNGKRFFFNSESPYSSNAKKNDMDYSSTTSTCTKESIKRK